MAYPNYINYKFALARGENNVTLTSIYGYCNTMSNTSGFILSPKNLYAMTTPTINTANAQYMRISSSDANDATAGTGMIQCYVEGIDEDGNRLSEAVLVSGQTPKTTTGKYVAINRMYAYTCGSGGINAGDIYITGNGDSTTAGVPKSTSTSYSIMAAGDGRSADARYVVPNSYTAYITQVITGQNNSTDNTILRAYEKKPGQPKQLLALTVGDRALQFDIPIKITAKSYFWVEGYSGISVTNAYVIVQMALFNDD